MKKLLVTLFIILVSTAVQAQEPEGYGEYYGDRERDAYVRNTGNTPEILSAGLIDTTDVPPNPYDDFAMQFKPPQIIRFFHQPLLDSTLNFEIGFDLKLEAFGATQYIFGQHVVGTGYATNMQCWVTAGNVLTFRRGDTSYTGPTVTNAFDRYRIVFETDSLRIYRNDSLKNAYPTTLTDVGYGDGRAFAWGSGNELVNLTLGNILGGSLTGQIDNVYARVTIDGNDTVLFCENFNNGASQQPADSVGYFFMDRSYGPHDYIGTGFWNGYCEQCPDPYDASYIYRGGTRKDVLKYYPIERNWSLRTWTILGYQRCGNGQVFVKPSDSSIVALVGGYFVGYDSTQDVSNFVTLWNGTSIISLGSGIDDDASAFWGAWILDSLFIMGSFDSAGGKPAKNITKCNTKTGEWFPLGNGLDTAPAQILVFRDTLFAITGSRLMAWHDSTWSTIHIYSLAPTEWLSSMTIFNDDIIVAIGGNGVYTRNGIKFIELDPDLNGVPGQLAYIVYGAMYQDSKKRLWIGGWFDTLNGIPASCVAYYDGGTIHSVGTGARGIAGDTIHILPPAYVTRFTEWQGAIIMGGMFRYLNDRLISIIAMYQNNKVQVLDYGPDFMIWGLTTYNKDGYKDLILGGDFSSVSGLASGIYAGRYSEEHFKVIKPLITFTPQIDIPATQYPPTIIVTAWSPAWRTLTVTVDYHINYDGDDSSFTMTKSDSSLTNTKGVWDYNWTGTFGLDTVASPDTIFYTITATDNLGNSHDTSSYFEIIYPNYVATPTYIFDYTDLSNGAVSIWTNQQDTFSLRQGTGANQPTKGATGITFDSTDILEIRNNVPHPGDSMTIIIQMLIPDTNTATRQQIITWRESTPNIKVLGMQMQTEATGTYRQLGTSYYDGVGYTHKTYITNLGNHFNTSSVFAFVADSVNKQSVTVNDVLGVNQGAPYSTTASADYFGLGPVEGSGGMRNCIIKRILIYLNRSLTASELTQNYNALIARP